MERIISGIPQGSILGPLPFDNSLNDLLLFIISYAGNNTLYNSGINLEHVKQTLEGYFQRAAKWFYGKYMVLKSDFFCFHVSWKEYGEQHILE